MEAVKEPSESPWVWRDGKLYYEGPRRPRPEPIPPTLVRTAEEHEARFGWLRDTTYDFDAVQRCRERERGPLPEVPE